MADEETKQAAPAEQTPMTMENAVAIIRKNQEKDFDRHDLAERLKIAQRRSKCGHAGNNPLFGMVFDNPSIEYSLDELKALVPLERDRLNYNWVNEKKETSGCLAVNRHGLYSVPKGHGRRKPHMNLRQQAIKSEALRLFKQLMEQAAETLKATCKTEEIEYLGVPESTMQELAQKATRLALRNVMGRRKAKSRADRRRKEHSRKVNAGLLTISTSETRYVNRGGAYGR
jgi:hypothetical protein